MRKRILIADDSETVRNVVKSFLASVEEIEVCGEAADGLETVQKAKQLDPDLVLLDVSMPEMNGAEVASVLKSSKPSILIILFTMYSSHVGKSLMSALGVDAVLSKPDGMAQLVSSIKTVLSSPPRVPEI
jgi:DNA-binding NarL/FixJ family response regulator